MPDFGHIPNGLRCKVCGVEIVRQGVTAFDYRQREASECIDCIHKHDEFWRIMDKFK